MGLVLPSGPRNEKKGAGPGENRRPLKGANGGIGVGAVFREGTDVAAF